MDEREKLLSPIQQQALTKLTRQWQTADALDEYEPTLNALVAARLVERYETPIAYISHGHYGTWYRLPPAPCQHSNAGSKGALLGPGGAAGDF